MNTDAPTPLDLDAIVAAIAECRTYNFGMYQADRLAHEHAPALVEEVERLRAEVDRLTTRPAPAWEEEVVRGAFIDARLASALEVMADGYPSVCIRSNEEAADVALAVVRDHLPVKPSREAMGAAIRDALKARTGGHFGLSEYDLADVVLDLLPGRSEADVEAEVLRDFAARVRDEMDDSDKVLGTKWATDEYRHGMRSALMQATERADRLGGSS